MAKTSTASRELVPAAVSDTSGAVIFSSSEEGQAHVLAHRMLDAGCYREGHAQLSHWLEGRTGSGEKWTHLHWHMIVFEIACGEISAARHRFDREIAPFISAGQVMTDAPTAMWQLTLAGSDPLTMPWQSVADVASSTLMEATPFVKLHGLLALAGAGSVGEIRDFLSELAEMPMKLTEKRTLFHLGRGLIDALEGKQLRGRRHLGKARLGELGGSGAQVQLINAIFDQCLGGLSQFHGAYHGQYHARLAD